MKETEDRNRKKASVYGIATDDEKRDAGLTGSL
jgi:hypothetical protein